ncbi:MAG TPA: YibE/F family protein [Kutzneria sp.]|jgi:uncharacterized membrane protein
MENGTRGKARAGTSQDVVMSHGHGHGHGPAVPASARVRRLVIGLLLPLAALTVVGVVLLFPWGGHTTNPQAMVTEYGVVTKVVASDCGGGGGGGGKQCEAITVQLDNQQTITEPMPIEPSTPRFTVGDKVVLGYNGADPSDPSSYQLLDFQRGFPLALLGVLFAAAVLILGKMQGLKALGALVLTFVVIVLFVLPAMTAGKDPLTVGVVGAAVIMFIVLYLTHGLSARTSTAVVGTLVSLGLIGVLGWLFSVVADLTGLDEDTANLISVLGHGIDARGLLLAGIVIGSVGVLDDVTVTQTSAVWELRRANPKLGWRELYAAGLRIGRDHMSSSVNTLVMAYAGAGLPLLLAYSASGRGLTDLLTAETVAQELVRTLVGSIGLVASVPITTLLAAMIARQEQIDEPEVAEPETPEPETPKTAKKPEPEQPVRRKRVNPDDMPTERFEGVRPVPQNPPGAQQHQPTQALRRPQPRRQPPPEQPTQVAPRHGQLPPPPARRQPPGQARRLPPPPELPGGHPSAPPELRNRPLRPPDIDAEDQPRR